MPSSPLQWGLCCAGLKKAPSLTFAPAALGVSGTVLLSLNFVILLIAPYRLDESSGAYLQLLHDLGFMMTFPRFNHLRFNVF